MYEVSVDLIVVTQCSKAIMQDQNAGDNVQLLVKMQKLSINPQDHIVAQSSLNEVLHSTDLPQGVVPIQHQDVNQKTFAEEVFELYLKIAKDQVRIRENAKNCDRKRCQSLEELERFDKILKDHADDLLGRLQKLKKTAAELNRFNDACVISELINHVAGEK
ncbi:hypothetical protein QL285_041211 [Trifolium repens]|nr:hypothetical protein QL285_041211 [Trifolium repens]